ncbi:MAG: hypothetical protein ACFE85_01490 [Candidatus Hodarchaeota archaeon]
MRRRSNKSEKIENKFTEKFRAVLDNSTSVSMYNEKRRSICVIRKNLAKDYEIDVDASEAPIINKMLNEPEPYESSIADLKILEEEVFPLIEAFQNVFGEEKELKLNSIKLAIGSSNTDYVTIRENDLIKYDVRPTLSGLRDFVKENDDSILGFLDCDYISEEGNIIYLSCGKKNVTDNIYSLKIKILASMQQRGFFLQQEHKYYGLQLFIIIESRKPDDDKLFEFLKELSIDWELIFFRRRLAIHDWTEIECERNSENLKSFIRVKYDTLNYFDINNIIRLIVKNQLPFKVADKMSSLLYKMKSERAIQMQEQRYEKARYNDEGFLESNIRSRRFQEDEKIQTVDEYSLTLKKAEIVAAANIACAYLGIHKDIKFDRDISIAEVLKYQEELTNF